MIRAPARLAATAITVLTVAVALTFAPVAASQNRTTGAPCKVAASSPVHIGAVPGGGVRGKGRFRCAHGQKHASFAVIVELRSGSRWVVRARGRITDRTVVGGRTYTLAKSRDCFPARYRTRAALTVGRRTMRAVSSVSKMTCGPPAAGSVSCDTEAQMPAIVNGQAVATGTVKCSESVSLFVDLQLQIFLDGRWNSAGEIQKGNFDARRDTTYTFTTPPFSCLHTPSQYRTALTVHINVVGSRTITKTTPIVELDC